MQRNKTRPRNLGDARPNLYKLWEGIYAGSTKALLSISQPYRPGKMPNNMDGFDNQNRR